MYLKFKWTLEDTFQELKKRFILVPISIVSFVVYSHPCVLM